MPHKNTLPSFDPLVNNNDTVTELLVGLLYGGKCLGYEKITVGAAVETLTIPDGARLAIMVVEGNAAAVNANKLIHFREDGVDPDNVTGMLLGDTWTNECKGTNLANFKAISKDGLNHIIHVHYYGNE